MADRINISLDAEGELLKAIDRVASQISAPDVLFQNLGAMLEVNINRRFDAKVDPDGAAWAPLAESTKASYAKKYGGSTPGSLLERTRGLRNNLAVNTGRDFAEIGFSLRVGKDAQWNLALLHETGTAKMPRRGLLTADPKTGQLGTEDRADIEHELAQFLSGAFGG